MIQNKKIILSPLDWGLGHATRCIPLIRKLLANQNEVWVAGNEQALTLFRSEFPDLPFLVLPGYNMEYARSAGNLPWKIAMQLPKMYHAMRYENRWLDQMISKHDFQLVLSDNRFGFYSKRIPSIFITHQLQIQAPNRLLQWMANTMNHHYIRNFTSCWVPDYPGSVLSGQLSDATCPIPVEFIGPLSRFIPAGQNKKPDIQLLAILSGPEPQRSILEEKILRELSNIPGKNIIIRGKPNSKDALSSEAFEIFSHVTSPVLQDYIERSACILSRAGYSSIMDYTILGKTALLVPTPGQTEQEYLAKKLSTEGKFAMCYQEDDLAKAVQQFMAKQEIK